ncbi:MULTISPECIES: PucR family transcriptional regulator [Streptomyces]|uniref:PucR family transcriptional regulator n=2 Tax=Streptomyces TaxID=1883 RepID=A0ABQ3NNS2_STRVG|nr:MULTISPECIES: PucR family transcriptional regulator [Streptomyces]KOU14497.1 hypothetical protein ADK49_23320 [Streptomyces sp. WM6349]KOU94172.1 hypothetical protein ADK92_22945 [Streptomyces sp. XY533]KOV40272.1 hypothetical protein ADK98_30630 [Streptomyces sp. H036]MBP2341710.1 sugar diacid utilization regulator [Streptomyces virginiae]MCI4079406.1 PucR family transcriptional regulator ligand-binding domain-containing protein [Streptomyces sp. MMS21 TC-5]
MRLRELLDGDELGLRLLVGRGAGDGPDGVPDRLISAVPTIDLADPGRFLTGGELVLTGLAWWRGDGDAEPFVRVLARAGVTALAAGEVEHRLVPHDLVRACRLHGVPLVAVPPETSFATITERVLHRLPRLHRRDVGSLAAMVERHRRLLADRAAPDSVLELLRQSLGLDVRVLSATGRQIAGAQPALRPGTASALAARYLAARRAREEAPYRVGVGERLYCLVPVPGAAGPAAELGDWLVVVEAGTGSPTAPDVELLDRLVELLADARSAHERSNAARRDLARRSLDLVSDSGVPAEEIPVRLRSTAQAVISGVGTWPRCQYVVAGGEWQGGRPVPASALRVLLEEALVQEGGAAPVSAQDIAATVDGDEVVLMVLAPGAALDHAALRRRLSAALARWLGPADSVCVGVGTPVADPGNARRGLAEARNALRIAREGPERVTVRGPADLTAHILSLLPLIPADARRAFAERHLGPLRDHDRRHRTQLLATLEAFLDCDASWSRTAARLRLHVNSLRQRVARIEEVTGTDLGRLETRLDFLAALRAV